MNREDSGPFCRESLPYPSYAREAGRTPSAVSDTFLPWWEDLSRDEQQAVLREDVDWSGFTEADEDNVINRVIDAQEPEFWMDGVEVASDPKYRVGDTTHYLVEAIRLDVSPRGYAIVDFGLDSQEHYEALYYPVREGEITPEQLDAAFGHGEKLTALARAAPSNPHKDIEFHTSWDVLLGREPPSSNGNATPQTATRQMGSGTLPNSTDRAQYQTQDQDRDMER
jgi:hypothetical protein